jgi:hypothetical protein
MSAPVLAGHADDAAMYYEKAAHLMEADRALGMAETLLDRALRCRIESRSCSAAMRASCRNPSSIFVCTWQA